VTVTDRPGPRALLVRALDVLAVLAVLGGVVVAATGGATLRGLALTRPEAFVVATAVLVGLRALFRPFVLTVRAPERIVVVAVLVYVLAMGFVVVTRHWMLRTHALDLGQYVQTVWSVAHGHGAVFTVIPEYVTTARMHAWGDHFSPILYILVPIVRVAPDAALAALIFQTVVLALGAVAVFGYAGGHASVSARVAAAFAAVYLLNPSLHGINLRDIHPAAFAIPLLIAAALAHDRRRFGWCALAVIAAAACREDAAVAVVGFGIWLALARGRWAVGATVAAAAVVLLLVDLEVIMPYFRGGAGYHHLYRYAHLGESLGEILVSIGVRPWRWIGVLVTASKVVYLIALLAPLGFLPLLAPRTLAAAVPGLAMNVLSNDPILINYRSQYQSFVLPFLVLAAVDGYGVLQRRGAHRPFPGVALGAAACFALILTARTFNDFSITKWRPGEDQRGAHALMAMIPPDTAVSANERLVPHLVMREDVFVFPRGLGISTHVVERSEVLARTSASGYVETARRGGWVLLERAAR
jgi:uncharacterized membrane protein